MGTLASDNPASNIPDFVLSQPAMVSAMRKLVLDYAADNIGANLVSFGYAETHHELPIREKFHE